MCPNPQETADLATFTEETLTENLFFVQCITRYRLQNELGIFNP